MKDWIEKLNSFLTLNDRDLLTGAGKVSAEMARQLAEKEYEKFYTNCRFIEAEEADEELKQAIKRLVEGQKGKARDT